MTMTGRLRGIVVLLAAALLAACASAPDRPASPEAASGFRLGLYSTTAARYMAAISNGRRWT